MPPKVRKSSQINWQLSDFEGFVTDLQAGYENADFETLLEGIKSYLEAEGIKLK